MAGESDVAGWRQASEFSKDQSFWIGGTTRTLREYADAEAHCSQRLDRGQLPASMGDLRFEVMLAAVALDLGSERGRLT